MIENHFIGGSMVKISFLLVNYNMRGLVEQCIKSIACQLKDLSMPHEVLIADNSVQLDYSFTEKNSSYLDDVTIFPIENKGWVHALNYLLERTKGEYVCICHPDIEFNDNCLRDMIYFLDQNSSAGVISPNMIYPDGSFNKIRLKFPTLRTEIKRVINIISYVLLKKKYIDDEVLWDRASNIEVDTVMSVCMIIRRRIIDTMQFLPDSFFMYYANDYICLQSKRQGFNNFYLNEAIIVHHERFADPQLYSACKSLDYKKTPVPIADRMERDKFIFLKFLYNKPTYFFFKMISILEFSIHACASIKQNKNLSNKTTVKMFDTIRVIWKT